MKKLLFVVTFSLLLSYCNGQFFNENDFAEMPPPAISSPEWYKLNNPNKEISVALIDGKIQFSKFIYTSSIKYNVPGGKLLAVDMGEFGGGLYYQSNDSSKKMFYINGIPGGLKNDPFRSGLWIPEDNPVSKLIQNHLLLKNGNVKFIFSYRDTTYFLEGFSHMSFNYGALYKIGLSNDSFFVAKVIDFKDAPMAMTVFHDTILIATYKGFNIVKGYDKELVFEKLFWSGLYPNSLVAIDEKSIYVGIRGGYVKINLPKKEFHFYKYIK